MFGLGLLVLVLAAMACSALRMNTVVLYTTQNCSGTPQDAVPTKPPGMCEAISSKSSRSLSCGVQTSWDAPNCQGSGTTFFTIPCFNVDGGSVAYSCAEFDRMVKVQIRYGTCSDKTTNDLYLQLDRCTAISAPSPSTGNVTRRLSYKVTQNGEGYNFGYYYNSDCTSVGRGFSLPRLGECVTTDTGNALQSVIVNAMNSSPTALGATWGVMMVVLAFFS
ncbi:hypothetical protein BASA81_017375 [Batrachochytrium salamandrivorans]|nr:hypothetical protein BASA81_017375 [Batrachochytrium salamandrivorans]